MNKNLLQTLLIIVITLVGVSGLSAQTKNINVTNFTVSVKQENLSVEWKTDGAAETNYFAIQKSADGINFKTVALVLGPDPKQPNCDCYAGFDKFLPKSSKNSYYRLVHVNADGSEQVNEAKLLAKS